MRYAIIFTFTCMLSAATADTIHVPGDYPTIQKAIDAAANGDIIIVAPGRYFENIDYKDKWLTLKSEAGPYYTIIDGNQSGSVVRMDGYQETLDGFTITNGFAQYPYPAGGGIFIINGEPDIMNCIIVDNNAISQGDAIMCDDGLVYLYNCIIYSNGSYDDTIYCYYMSYIKFINCTIDDNIHVHVDSSAHVENSILWNCHVLVTDFSSPSGFSAKYSNIDKNKIHVDPGCYLTWGPGNINGDPLYTDKSSGDFHILYQSPCRDSGNNSYILNSLDFEGDPRIAYGTVDMGADEFYTHLYVTGDKTPGGSIQGKFVGLPSASPVGLFIGSGVLPSPMLTMWGEYWLQTPWVLIPLLFPPSGIPSDGVMVLPTTLPPGMTVPVDIPMQALIGLNADSLSNLEVLEVR